MSGITTIRLSNYRYNDGLYQIPDLILSPEGVHTLALLENGSGKTFMFHAILSTMLSGTRNWTAGRPYRDLFHEKPSLTAIEWEMENGAGYFIHGTIGRKIRASAVAGDSNQSAKTGDSLEVHAFTFHSRIWVDISTLPFTKENGLGGRTPESIQGFEERLEGLCAQIEKGSLKFYNFMDPRQTKNYLNTLIAHGIDVSLMRQCAELSQNRSEDGLSDMIKGCEKTDDLVWKKLIPEVEKKITEEAENTAASTITALREEVNGVMREYRDNAGLIHQKAAFDETIAFLDELTVKETKLQQSRSDLLKTRQLKGELYYQALWGKEACIKKTDDLESESASLQQEIRDLCAEKASKEVWEYKEAFEKADAALKEGQKELHAIKCQEEAALRQYHLQNMARDQIENDRLGAEFHAREEEVKRLKEGSDKGLTMRTAGRLLYDHYAAEEDKNRETVTQCQEEIRKLGISKEKRKDDKRKRDEQKQKAAIVIGTLKEKISIFNTELTRYNDRIGEENVEELGTAKSVQLTLNLAGLIDDQQFRSAQEYHEGRVKSAEFSLDKTEAALKEIESEIRDTENSLNEIRDTLMRLTLMLEDCEERQRKYDADINVRRQIADSFQLAQTSFENKEGLLEELDSRMRVKSAKIEELKKTRERLQEEIERLRKREFVSFDQEFLKVLDEKGINYIRGDQYLFESGFDQELFTHNRHLPYSIILQDRRDFEKVRALGICSSQPVLLLEREKAGEEITCENLYTGFPKEYQTKEAIDQTLKSKEAQAEETEENIQELQNQLREYEEGKKQIEQTTATATDIAENRQRLAETQKTRQEKEELQTQRQIKLVKNQEKKESLVNDRDVYKAALIEAQDGLDYFQKIRDDYRRFEEHISELSRNEQLLHTIDVENQREEKIQAEEDRRSDDLTEQRLRAAARQRASREQADRFESYKAELIPDDSTLREQTCEALLNIYEECKKEDRELSEALEQFEKAGVNFKNNTDALKERGREYGLRENEWKDTVLNEETLIRYKQCSQEMKEQRGESEEKTAQLKTAADKKEELYEKSEKDTINEYGAVLEKDEIRDIDHKAWIKEREERQKTIRREISAVGQNKDSYSDCVSKLEGYAAAGVKTSDEMAEILPPEEVRQRHSALNAEEQKYDREVRQRTGDVNNSLNNHSQKIQSQNKEGSLSQLQSAIENLKDFACNEKRTTGLLDRIAGIKKTLSDLILHAQNEVAKFTDEKERTVSLLLGHVRMVNSELKIMGEGSYARINGRRVQMFAISVPDWDQHKEEYRNNAREYLDEILKKGMQQVHDDPTKEIDGVRLYQQVVGTGKITISVNKVETIGEVRKKSWEKIARFSGGENTLAAFILYISLLFYHKGSDPKLKNTRTSVLMDNPFAKMQSGHLVETMTQIADYCNVSLFCTTAIANESIRSYFPNVICLGVRQTLPGSKIRGVLVEEEQEYTKHTPAAMHALRYSYETVES